MLGRIKTYGAVIVPGTCCRSTPFASMLSTPVMEALEQPIFTSGLARNITQIFRPSGTSAGRSMLCQRGPLDGILITCSASFSPRQVKLRSCRAEDFDHQMAWDYSVEQELRPV